MNKIFLSYICIIVLKANVFSAVYTVITTADNGPGSLRAATNDANSSAGGDQIYFNIPVSDSGYDAATGVWTIQLASSLPMLTGAFITIDATSQTTNQGDTNPYGPEIRITTTTQISYPFILVSPGNNIKGFIIDGFEYGILIYNSTSYNNTVSDNYIGVNYTGTLSSPNQYGVGIGGNAYGNTVSGNLISGNTQAGIAITSSTNNVIKNNKLGTDISGDTAVPNLYGIALQDASNNYIGDQLLQNRNLISGNTFAGIVIEGLQSTGNTIAGNYIGTNWIADSPVPNENGIILSYASNTSIGGSIVQNRNIISGNTGAGIILNGTGTRLNTIKGNFIGTDPSGYQAISNYAGIVLKSNANSNIIGGTAVAEKNIVSGNIEIGIYIEASDSNMIVGNFIGPDISGTEAFKVNDTLLQANGIEFNTVAKHNRLGGYLPEERNIISGNRVYGMVYYGNTSHNSVIGNYIGVDVSGNSPLPNATGICVDGGSHHNPIINNVLSGNISYGIFIVTNQTFYNEVKGNMIGTNASGTAAVPNDAGLLLGGGACCNLIGGDLPQDRNIISGNRYGGIEVSDQLTRENLIRGNHIGTDITGTYAIPNHYGIGITSGPRTNIIDENIISGNTEFGLLLFENADSNRITGNTIGTASDLVSPLGNGIAGIVIWGGSSHNRIGASGQGNIIAHHDSLGILIKDANTKFNTISGNSIFQNNHMGIDLAPEGPNYNDAGDTDDGPNGLMNHPVIQHAAKDPASANFWAYGIIDTQQPDGTVIEVFLSDGNPYNRGEGKVFLGQTIANSSGEWTICVQGASEGNMITATATDPLGNTSEFSPNFTVIQSVEHISQTPEITVFPNPANDMLYIRTQTEFTSIKIFTSEGKEVQLSRTDKSGNLYSVYLPDQCATGIYHLLCVGPEHKISVSSITILK
jgi:parallel beta-helix repeat protein